MGTGLEQAISLEHLLDSAQGLLRTLFIFDEGESHMIVPELTKAYPRTDGHFRLGKKFLGELERPETTIRRGNWRPDEHRSPGWLDRPPQFVQPLDEDIAALPVVLADFPDAILGAFQGADACHLERSEGPVVEVALQSR